MDKWEYAPQGILAAKRIEWNGVPVSEVAKTQYPQSGYMEAVCLHRKEYNEAGWLKKTFFKNKIHPSYKVNSPGLVETTSKYSFCEIRTYGQERFIQIMKKHKDGIDPDCTCGIYGWLEHIPVARSGNISILIESSGNVLVGENNIIRMEACQVVGIIQQDKEMPLSEFFVKEYVLYHFSDFSYEMAIETGQLAARYFDVPIFTLEEARELINKQRMKWLV